MQQVMLRSQLGALIFAALSVVLSYFLRTIIFACGNFEFSPVTPVRRRNFESFCPNFATFSIETAATLFQFLLSVSSGSR